MKKEKLLKARKQKGYTQKQIAEVISTDVSNYSRKETGDVKIIKEEWEKLANFMEVPFDEIYEEDHKKSNHPEIIDEDFYKGIIKELREYIALLKKENIRLKKSKK